MDYKDIANVVDPVEVERNIRNECHTCLYKENVPGDAHISCTNPDNSMTGKPHGIKMGWFIYPIVFDPVWKTKLCANYRSRNKGGTSG
jgi:hypothetical protein